VRLLLSLLTAAAIAVSIVACSDSFKPTTESVVGDYNLQSLTTTDTSGTTDWVAAGSTLTLTIAANGTTTGNLFIPGAAEGGGDFNADMAGTWSLSGSVITIDQTADTFVRDMDFKAGKDRLAGDQTFGFNAVPTRVRIVLTK
jgi:hypothetical protein